MPFKGFPFTQKLNFMGLDKASAPEMMLEGAAEDCLDVYSSPLGGLATRNGMARLNTTSVSATAVVTGGWQFKAAGTNYNVMATNDAKWYLVATAGTTEELFSSMGTTDDDKHWSFFNARDNAGALIMVGVHADIPRAYKYTGSGSAATLAGTIITADFAIEWQRYYWLHQPNSCDVYYNTTIDNAESGYSSYLRFDENDPGDYVRGMGKSGDDMLAFKRWSVIRTMFRPGAGASKFQKLTIEGGIGTESHWSIQTLPTGQVVWLAPDSNFYMLSGNVLRPIADLIQPFLRACSQSRLQYVDSGINRKLGHCWWTITYGSANSTHNRTLVLDYLHPYRDKKGQLQYPWWVYSRTCHTLWEAFVSGVPYLYSGDYTGFANKEDSGTDDAGTAIPNNGYWLSKPYSFGDPTLEKKFRVLPLSVEYKGTYSMYAEFIMEKDQGTSSVKEIALSRGASGLALWDSAEWDVDSWSADQPMDTSVHIDRVGKVLQIKLFGDTVTQRPWRVYNFTPYVTPLKATHRSREG